MSLESKLDQKANIPTKKEKTEDKFNLSLSSSSSSNDEAEKGEAEIRQEQEHKSNLVAHFYKFQEESGHPEKLVPQLGGNDVDIYNFYNVVKRLGGHRSITKENRWPKVLKKLKLDLSKGGDVDAVQVRKTYICYFEKFESFMNKLGNSSLLVAAASSTSTSQRNTRIVRTIATPTQPGDSKTSKRSRGGKSSSSVRGGSSGGTLSRSRSSSVKDHSPAFSVGTKSSAKSSKKSSEEPQELQPIQHGFSSTFSTYQQFESPISHKRTMSFNIGKEKTISKFIKKSSPSTSKSTENENKIDKNYVSLQQNFIGAEMKSHQTNKILPIKLPESISPTKPNLSPSANLKKTLSVQTSQNIPSTSSETSIIIKKSNVEGTVVEGQINNQNIINKKPSFGTETSSPPNQQNIKIPQQRGRKPKHAIFPQQPNERSGTEIGYSNAHIFTRFYQGQKVNARHHLRFYDARVITVKQPSLADIARALNNAFALSRITHQSSPDIKILSLENMGPELKDALRNLMNSTKIFVHYLGWNSRYDEWLMLHKIRVEEKDERSSAQQVENHLIKSSNSDHSLLPQLLAVALDWCGSCEGIPSLTSLPSAQSSEQRPRRLSASQALVKTTNVSSSCVSDNNSNSPRRQSCSTSSTMDYRSPLNPFAPHHAPPSTSTTTTFSSSIGVGFTPPLNTMTHSLVKFTIPHLPVIPQLSPLSVVPEVVSTQIPIITQSNNKNNNLNLINKNNDIIKEEEEIEQNNKKQNNLQQQTKIRKTFSSSSPTKDHYNLPSNLNINNLQITTTTINNKNIINNNLTSTTTTSTTTTTTSSSSSSKIIFPSIISSTSNLSQNNNNNKLLILDNSSTIYNLNNNNNSKSTSASSFSSFLLEEKLKDSESCLKQQSSFVDIKEEENERNEDLLLFRLSPPPAPPILLITKEEEENCYNNSHFIKKDENKAKAKITLSINTSTSSISLNVSPPSKNLSNNNNINSLQQTTTWAPKKRKNGESVIIGAMSPPPNKITRNNIKSPAKSTNNNNSSNSINALISSSRSPLVGNNEATSDEEENNFEGVQSESLHCLRQRLLHKMESEHLFDNDNFLGLPNLEEMLEKCIDEPDKQVQLIEQRMRELHGIFHEYKGKLSEYEKQNRRRRKKEQSTTTNAIIAGSIIQNNL